jgi:phosphohistidine phosphatase SixA
MGLLRCSIFVGCFATLLGAHAGERNALPDPATALSGPALVEVMQKGGVTLYFRHGATEPQQIDRKDVAFDDCDNQRNLSELGRAESRAIGAALSALGLPLGEVLASPYCRTMETARLITGRATASRAVLGMMSSTGKPDYSQLDEILATPPAPGTIRVIASHGNSLHALAGDPELAEGEVAVVRGDGKNWKILARLGAGQWAALSRSASPADAGSAPKRSGPN